MATVTRKLTERVERPFSGSRVDRDAGVIRGVLICGTSSDNARDYPPAVFRRDYRAYEGRVVNADHGREPSVSRRLGWFENVRPGADGRPRGDFHILKSHPLAEQVFEAAERNPALFGFSHVALCDTRRQGGRTVVEAIKSVESVDLVANPATTKSLFESRTGPRAMKLRDLMESLAPRLPDDTQKRIGQQLDAMDDSPAAAAVGDTPVDAPADDADPDAALWAGFNDAIQKILDRYAADQDAAAAIKAIATYLKTHANIVGGSGGEDPSGSEPLADDGDADGPVPKTGESRRVDPWDVLRECDGEEFRPTPTQLELLATIPDPARRLAFIRESREQLTAARVTESRPTSHARTRPTAAGASADAKAFVESITR
jgi:hypothetical protein